MTFRFIFPHNVVAHYYKKKLFVPLHLPFVYGEVANIQSKTKLHGTRDFFCDLFCHFANIFEKEMFCQKSHVKKNHQKNNSLLQNHPKSTKLPTL